MKLIDECGKISGWVFVFDNGEMKIRSKLFLQAILNSVSLCIDVASKKLFLLKFLQKTFEKFFLRSLR